MIFDYDKLNGKIKEHFKNRSDFCKLISLSNTSLSKKMNNKVPFTSPEIDKTEIHIYFYTLKVEKVQ